LRAALQLRGSPPATGNGGKVPLHTNSELVRTTSASFV
jgi:hypothetical protein